MIERFFSSKKIAWPHTITKIITKPHWNKQGEVDFIYVHLLN